MLERVERAHEVELRIRKGHGGRIGFDEAYAGIARRVVEQCIREVERGGVAPAFARWRLTIPSAQAISRVLAPGPFNIGASTRARSAPRRSSDSRS